MSDDLGYGDVGFNGNQVIRTPHLDQMRSEGAKFRRFYAGGPVCSPTRATCLTGRHYSRYGITHANRGRLPTHEITLARICKEYGYTTGHFGKWHLGTLTDSERDSNRGRPGNSEDYSPPWIHGFDVCFSTEAMVPTWDPAVTPDETRDGVPLYGEPGAPFGTAYWNEYGEKVTEGLQGDDSRVIVDRAEPFIRKAVATQQPFLAVIWFHAPHYPVVAGPEYLALYPDCSLEEAHYYGCITAMDDQVGRINQLVSDLSIEANTVIWFCSDNGPAGGEVLDENGRNRGETGGLRGRKKSLFDGGVRVPALVKWPGVIPPGAEYAMPSSTLDYLPTLVGILEYEMPDDRPLDGTSLIPLIQGRVLERTTPIPYRFVETRDSMFGSPTVALNDGSWKLLTNLLPDRKDDMLFDLDSSSDEVENVAYQHPERVAMMRDQLIEFIDSCRASHDGADYGGIGDSTTDFQELNGWEAQEFPWAHPQAE